MSKEVGEGDLERIAVKLADGTTWEAEFKDGKLLLTKEISSPPPPPPPPFKSYVPPEPIMAKPEPADDDEDDDDEDEDDLVTPEAALPDNAFRARLRSIMTDNMYDRRVRGKTRGRLDMRRLWKAETMATNLFTQKQARLNKQYNIVLLVDESGSMFGEKIQKAAQVATFLAETFKGLNLNLAIVGFNGYMTLHKDFDEKLPDLDLLRKTMVQLAGSSAMGSGYNNDFEAMSYAYKMFEGRKGQNFLIMLSDGQPETHEAVRGVLTAANPIKAYKAAMDGDHERPYYRHADLMGKEGFLYVNTESLLDYEEREEMSNLQHMAEGHKGVTSIGIGLECTCEQIPNNISVSNMEQLKPLLLKQIEKTVKRG